MPPRFTRNSDRPRASDRTMVDTEDTRTRLQRFPTRSASSPSADEPHGWQQARAKPLERIGGHTYYSGLDVEKQSRSGQSGAFFLTFLFIELIDGFFKTQSHISPSPSQSQKKVQGQPLRPKSVIAPAAVSCRGRVLKREALCNARSKPHSEHRFGQPVSVTSNTFAA